MYKDPLILHECGTIALNTFRQELLLQNKYAIINIEPEIMKEND